MCNDEPAMVVPASKLLMMSSCAWKTAPTFRWTPVPKELGRSGSSPREGISFGAGAIPYAYVYRMT